MGRETEIIVVKKEIGLVCGGKQEIEKIERNMVFIFEKKVGVTTLILD